MKASSRKVVLIGWDAADWKFLSPLMDQGLMPNLSKLVEGGVKGKLATLDPPLSPTLWTSIATGKRPYKHGIHGFVEPTPSGNNIRPIYNTNRKVKAIWNILTQHNLHTHVVGWWPSHPAEPINGVMVSNFFQRMDKPINQPNPMVEGTIHPKNLSDTFAKLRIHPWELTEAHILPFVPNAKKINQTKDIRLQMLTKTIADCSSLHAASTYILDNFELNFMGIYLDAIDHFCHGFMKYHPPHRAHVSKQDFELYKNVVNGGCIYHDMMLGRIMEMVDEDTTIILISDHGFHPGINRPTVIPDEPAGPEVEHSPYGIIVMNGPGIKKDELLFGASLLDITPTILSLYNLPVAEDMDGKVLINAFENPPEVKTIHSWENIKGEDGSHKEDLEISEADMEAEIQQLVALGYIEDPSENGEETVTKVKNENDYYLARAFFDGSKWAEGIEILERLLQANPKVSRYGIRLIQGYQVLGKHKDARRIINHIRENHDSESSKIDLLDASLLITEERHEKALTLLNKVKTEAGLSPTLSMQLASTYLHLHKIEEALTVIQELIQKDAENMEAHFLLGVCYFRSGKYEKSADSFLQAIGLKYYYPSSHFYLGEALVALEKFDAAVDAFDTCLKIAPGMNQARERLITIYEKFLNQPGKALKYKKSFQEQIIGTITIVSGLPRSGTSMMMQMLEAGGLEIFTDKKRMADESNPKGYYEHEAIKGVKKNKAFLKDANHKVAKVIAQLLPFFPMNYQYKIVFMERNIHEIMASQHKMLERDGKKSNSETLSLSILKQYKSTLDKVKAWAKSQPNVTIHYVDYTDVINEPFHQAMLINDFLETDLEVEKMAAAVDHRLYREKT